MRRCFVLALALPLSAGLLFAPIPAQAGTGTRIEVVPSAPTTLPGDSVEVAVVVSGFGDQAAPSLGAYDLVLTFDSAVFAFDALAFGPDFGAATTDSVPGTGDLEAVAVSFLSPTELNMQQPGLLTLFTVTFDAVALGSGAFDITVNAALGDESGAPLPPPVTVPAEILVGALPIPTASQWVLWLLAATLGLIAMRRLAVERSLR